MRSNNAAHLNCEVNQASVLYRRFLLHEMLLHNFFSQLWHRSRDVATLLEEKQPLELQQLA